VRLRIGIHIGRPTLTDERANFRLLTWRKGEEIMDKIRLEVRVRSHPLSLKLPSNELPQLDNLLFTGGHLSQIEVAGYANSGGTQMLVDDYLFGTDFLTAASTDISGAQQLSVAFGQVQQSHYVCVGSFRGRRRTELLPLTSTRSLRLAEARSRVVAALMEL
jgi:hypothetical protein